MHDLNGPLNNFVLTLTLFETSLAHAGQGAIAPDLLARWRRYLQVLRSESQRFAECSRELADAANPLQSKSRRVDFGTLVRDVLSLLRDQATAREIRLDGEVPDRTPCGLGDPTMLRLAVLECLSRLMDVTAPGGRIEVDVEPQAHDARAIVHVAAHGTQLPDEVLREFYRLLFLPESDSIGLVAGRVIVAEHGGEAVLSAGAAESPGVELRLPVA